MRFLELVRKRHSVRNYAQAPVSREIIDRCLEAARLAPSACNSQPWTFIVIDDRNLIAACADQVFSGMYSMNSFVKNAPVLIVVITERSAYSATLGGYFRGTQYSLIDIGIACEHLVLQAAEEGLGTCWIGWFNEKKMKKLLGLSRPAKIDVIISMGYPIDQPAGGTPRKSLDQIRRYHPAHGSTP
ncbi:MAG: nitroreductase family protein [Candidatus Aureabacteria bacterium]|nr:nitroreductase family protein [Candidatus Auribacterota bacterium]